MYFNTCCYDQSSTENTGLGVHVFLTTFTNFACESDLFILPKYQENIYVNYFIVILCIDFGTELYYCIYVRDFGNETRFQVDFSE